jgi:DNA-binding beta-propeller fold protein YncE
MISDRAERVAIVVAMFLLASINAVHADWVNGQNASFVIGQADFTSTGGATSQNRLGARPTGVAVDFRHNKIYVADSDNNRVLRFGYPIIANQPEAEAVLGQADFSANAPNRGGAPQANTLFGPYGLAVDNGTLFVSDRFNFRVLRFDNAHNAPDGADADGVLGQPDFTTAVAGVTRNTCGETLGLTLSGGSLWVCDDGNRRVLRFDNAAQLANGADADAVLGQSSFTTSVSATTPSGLAGAQDAFLDPFGSLWLADEENDRVLLFDHAATLANGPDADAVLGQADFVSNLNATAQNRLFNPSGVTVDGSGTLYVADRDNHRVMIFEDAWSKTDGADADFVLGQTMFFTATAGTSPSAMTSPVGLAVNETGDTLLVADHNGRVMVYGDGLPSIPVALDATDRSSSAFTANWNPADGANTYRLDVSTRSDFSAFVSGYQHRPVAGTSERVSGLSSARTHYYRVRAVNAAGTSDYSNRISANTTGVFVSGSCFIQTLTDRLAEP